ncbi:MAG TPA: DEAD/DEAH box helicase [Micavibrio sp.]|nr:DEAD/DEAH box helicase [Micavibrio sp.]HIL29324.1 DEAD/DEAH box helicase [Micavibrio sp.]
MSSSFDKLDKRIQKWIFKQGWESLRDIQNEAIEPILSGNQDVIISASTAAGKTEAFFLPACSATIDEKDGYSILYISPLKALINDQYRRLDSLSLMTEIYVTPWHGDVSQSVKSKSKRNPSGIVLITPESLESLLIRESGWLQRAFSSLKYIVIDEFHAFIGTERGQHLLSLLNRLDSLLQEIEKPVPRIALSATLGNLDEIPKALRQNAEIPCKIIKSDAAQSELKFRVQGYVDPIKENGNVPAHYKICDDLYKFCRGGSHLVFANSRKRTESISAQLSDMCEQDVVPNEFFPHHGSLDKNLREELEARLQKDNLPTTAICTMTLELGIDIGKVDSVIQVTAPHSVASLRQRLGRSGRRGSPAILRMLIAEKEIHADSNVIDKLRMELLQSLAMTRLLIMHKWYEPADMGNFHFSTLLHQILALTAQWGGIRADQVYRLLCKNGCFNNVTLEQFKSLLSHMGKENLITQLSSGELVLGLQGEFLTNNYTFYAVFKTPEEFRVIAGDKTLGTLPVDSLILEGQHIIFTGRRWKVESIETDKKTIHVSPSKGGEPPQFNGQGMLVHDLVRQEMLRIYESGDYKIPSDNGQVDYLDATAKELFYEGLEFFKIALLKDHRIFENNGYVYIVPWMGDKIVNTITTMLVKSGYTASAFAGVIEVEKTTMQKVMDCLKAFCEENNLTNTELAMYVSEKSIEKYDDFLPESLLIEGYGQKYFDIDSSIMWLKEKIFT